MPNNISKPLAFGEHAVCITNTSIHSFGELVDCLQLSLLPFSLTKLSLIIYIRKYLNGLPFRHSAQKQVKTWFESSSDQDKVLCTNKQLDEHFHAKKLAPIVIAQRCGAQFDWHGNVNVATTMGKLIYKFLKVGHAAKHQGWRVCTKHIDFSSQTLVILIDNKIHIEACANHPCWSQFDSLQYWDVNPAVRAGDPGWFLKAGGSNQGQKDCMKHCLLTFQPNHGSAFDKIHIMEEACANINVSTACWSQLDRSRVVSQSQY
jgi:hypothetical protein